MVLMTGVEVGLVGDDVSRQASGTIRGLYIHGATLGGGAEYRGEWSDARYSSYFIIRSDCVV